MVEDDIKIVNNGIRIEHWLNGFLHRLDGPAVYHANGKGPSFWYKNGQYHRLDGPAIDWGDGDFSWYKEGKYHRENGPAQDWRDTKMWFINGIRANGISETHLKLLMKYKYSQKYKSKNALEYQDDVEERKKLERLT